MNDEYHRSKSRTTPSQPDPGVHGLDRDISELIASQLRGPYGYDRLPGRPDPHPVPRQPQRSYGSDPPRARAIPSQPPLEATYGYVNSDLQGETRESYADLRPLVSTPPTPIPEEPSSKYTSGLEGGYPAPNQTHRERQKQSQTAPFEPQIPVRPQQPWETTSGQVPRSTPHAAHEQLSYRSYTLFGRDYKDPRSSDYFPEWTTSKNVQDDVNTEPFESFGERTSSRSDEDPDSHDSYSVRTAYQQRSHEGESRYGASDKLSGKHISKIL